MAEMTQSRKRPLRAIFQNPVTIKELRSRMRGRRGFAVLTAYLIAMGSLIILVYLAYASSGSQPYGPNARDAGKAVFAAVIAVESFLVIFVAPAFTAGAISGEKERQTYDLLRTTLLSARWLVLGKVTSALSYVFLLILASIPLQSIAFLLGGVSISEVLISQLSILVTAVAFAMFGLFCSSAMRNTLSASIVTFAGALFLTLIFPLIILLIVAIVGPILGSLNWIGEALLQVGAMVLAATNLPATLIMSEIILLQENSLFFFTTVVGGRTFWLFSPWPFFFFIYSLLSLIFFWLTVRRVRQVADR